ncbi:MAG: DUF4230 domain-containing protein [Verrucomicrobiota bacterium]|nr:DUF4230 domain-containing protein [Verrucomicrobiota bacterium]
MNQVISNLIWGLVCAGLVVLLLRRFWFYSGRKSRSMSIRTTAAIEELKAIGVLSVFKAVTKEIVTARDHSLGKVGKRYLEWLITSRKMAMIFEFDIDFQYDLRDPSFAVKNEGEGAYVMKMPPCIYVVHVRNVTFYDEQDEKLLPIILPDVINKILPGGFSEEDRNRLMEEARGQAEKLAQNLARRLSSEVQTSARQTMEMLAKSFGARSIRVEFPDTELHQVEAASMAAVEK